ncbi:MAG: SPOR domain-containing protein [Methyloceanibacter sp.]
MKNVLPLVLCLMLAAQQAFAGPTVEEGPLSPCAPPQGQAGGDSSQAQLAPAWGIVIATSFVKDDALAQFAKVKQDHSDILGSYEPIVVETCNLNMGTKLQYSARIGTDSREDAEALCAKLQEDGGACIVQKN